MDDLDYLLREICRACDVRLDEGTFDHFLTKFVQSANVDEMDTVEANDLIRGHIERIADCVRALPEDRAQRAYSVLRNHLSSAHIILRRIQAVLEAAAAGYKQKQRELHEDVQGAKTEAQRNEAERRLKEYEQDREAIRGGDVFLLYNKFISKWIG